MKQLNTTYRQIDTKDGQLRNLELQADAELHEPRVLLDGVGDPVLNPVAHTLLGLRVEFMQTMPHRD